jgi:hypothetical protein
MQINPNNAFEPRQLTEQEIASGTIQIGEVHVKTPIEYKQTYEVAAWSTILQSDTGIFPVFLQPYLSKTTDYSVSVKLPATIVDDFTPTLFGGVMVGRGNSNNGAKTSFQKSKFLSKAILESGGFAGDPHWAIYPNVWHLSEKRLTENLQYHKQALSMNWEKYETDHSAQFLSGISTWAKYLAETAKDLEEIERKKMYLMQSPEYLVNYDLEGLANNEHHVLLRKAEERLRKTG